MNIRMFAFWVLMTSAVGISFAVMPQASIKLLPKPVVFLDYGEIDRHGLEFIQFNKLQTCCPTGISDADWVQIKRLEALIKKVEVVSTEIAKKLGACAVIRYEKNMRSFLGYIDPEYNITQRVIDQLNKEYLATK